MQLSKETHVSNIEERETDIGFTDFAHQRSISFLSNPQPAFGQTHDVYGLHDTSAQHWATSRERKKHV
jgi:hypothetical protein